MVVIVLKTCCFPENNFHGFQNGGNLAWTHLHYLNAVVFFYFSVSCADNASTP